MKANAVVVFPNSNMGVEGKNAWTTKACRDFLQEIGSHRVVPMAAALASPRVEGTRNSSGTNTIEHFRFFSLGTASATGNTRLGKVLIYVYAFLRIFLRIPKKPMWYIFFPSHTGMLACLVCCLLRRRYGLYVRGEWKKLGVIGALNRYFFSRAAFIVATGRTFTNKLKDYNDNVQEVAPMMSFGKADLREKVSYKIDGEAVMLYVGQLHLQKGIFELIEAVSQIGKERAVRLVLVGDGSSEVVERLEAIIQEKNRPQVTIAGRVECRKELFQLFSEADIFAIPTYYPEGFPRVVYEAMCFGLPVVCTNIEGEPGFLRDGENCRYVEKQSAGDLAIKLSELLSDEGLRRRIGEGGFRDVEVLCKSFENTTHGAQVVRAMESCDL